MTDCNSTCEMASKTYIQFIDMLLKKSAYTFITVKSVEKIGSCIWPLLDVTFKDQLKMEHRRKAFWFFSQYIKRCIISKNSYALYDIWKYFSADAQKMWQQFPERSLKNKIDQIL